MSITIQQVEKLKKAVQETASAKARAEGMLESARDRLEQVAGTRDVKEAIAKLDELEAKEEAAQKELDEFVASLKTQYPEAFNGIA